MTLEGKTALITGSSRGIGKGIALALAENGVKIAIHYFQNERAAKETLEQVRKIGSNGFLVQADVMRPEHVSKSEDGASLFRIGSKPHALQKRGGKFAEGAALRRNGR